MTTNVRAVAAKEIRANLRKDINKYVNQCKDTESLESLQNTEYGYRMKDFITWWLMTNGYGEQAVDVVLNGAPNTKVKK